MLEVRTIDPGFARFAVVADAIVVVGRNAVTCSGGPPTTTNTNTVLLVDDSDDPSTSTPHDGNSTVEISDPQTFAAGATAEPTGTPEIEVPARHARKAEGGPHAGALLPSLRDHGKRPSVRIEVEARDAAGTRVVRTFHVRAVRK